MHRLSRPAAAVIAVAALLAACASNAATKTLNATLNAQEEVPPTSSPGTGTAVFTLDPGTRELTWKVTYANLTGPAAAAHIHGPAAPGANSGVLVNLAPNGVANPIEGTTKLTEAQVSDLLAGKTYVNIHTAAHKGGEIRGQILP
jgi:Cu/Zn superoxide dismutase